MKTEKKTFEKPTVQKVEFDFKTRIAASTCENMAAWKDDGWSICMNW